MIDKEQRSADVNAVAIDQREKIGSKMSKRPRSTLDDAAMTYAGDAFVQGIKDLIVDAEHPFMMQMILHSAIKGFAAIVASGADPETVTQETKGFIDDQSSPRSYVACAKHILLQHEADWPTAEADDDQPSTS
jgi:hypothetical protein